MKMKRKRKEGKEGPRSTLLCGDVWVATPLTKCFNYHQDHLHNMQNENEGPLVQNSVRMS